MGSLIPFHLKLFSICIIFAFIQVSNAVPKAQESDRVINLPGQPSSSNISHFSGYVTVNEDHGRALFYWFFEAQSQPSEKPLLLWLNGGPGCSSVGYGAAVELGPLRVGKNGDGLEINNYAWNQDAYNFLVNWLERFPQYKSHVFFISGESYAGHYVPQLAELVYDRNKDPTKYPFINLKGFIVGNPETEDYYDNKGILDYAWTHAVISDQVYEEANKKCNFKKYNWSDDCIEVMNGVFSTYKEIDIYNIYAPTCLLSTGSFSNTFTVEQVSGLRRSRIPGGYDPCFATYTEAYLNRIDVRSALHANTNGKWSTCNDSILNTYNYNEFYLSPIYFKLIKAGLKIWVYSGDADGRVPVTGSRYWIEALRLPLKAAWRSWYHKNQVGGRIIEYEGLTFVTVRGAGHLVPLNKPGESLALIHAYLSGGELPTQK